MQVSPLAMSQIMRFLYTGAIESQIINMAALKQVPFAISTKSPEIFSISHIFIHVSQTMFCCRRQQSTWNCPPCLATSPTSSTRTNISTHSWSNPTSW